MPLKLFAKRRTPLWKSLLLLTIATVSTVLGKFIHDDLAGMPNLPEEAVRSTPPPIDLSVLAQRASNPPVLTPEQIEEDERIDNEQVALAGEWLRSINPRQRIDGAEQLSAYPTAEAEKLLVDALVTDIDPEVRSAAAQSLAAFERPTQAAVAALLAAVEDENEDVRLSALNTLENIAAGEETGSPRYKKILAGLKKAAKSGRVPSETREAIRDFLQDQTSDR